MTYSPRGQTAEILQVALDLVKAAPYRVSARWVFYRLLQLGYFTGKGDYKDKFIKMTSAARHASYNGWRPDTLADETRETIVRTGSHETLGEWLGSYASNLVVNLDVWSQQDVYIEIWYEARAMTQQFEHYTQHITLRPMGGQPSIDYKYQTAQHLDYAAKRYGVPVVVLYFGDLDDAGGTIANVIERDVRKWCGIDFVFRRCGLTEQQVVAWDVPENPKKPGEYQWEALSDAGAEAIITQSISRHLRHDAFDAIEQRMQHATQWMREQFASMADNVTW